MSLAVLIYSSSKLFEKGYLLEFDNYFIWIFELCLLGIVFILSWLLARTSGVCCCICCCYTQDDLESMDNPVYVPPSAPTEGLPLPDVQTRTVNPVNIERGSISFFIQLLVDN